MKLIRVRAFPCVQMTVESLIYVLHCMELPTYLPSYEVTTILNEDLLARSYPES